LGAGVDSGFNLRVERALRAGRTGLLFVRNPSLSRET
jgi:hypothetical protein